jgi:membrane protein required for colicin V production
MIDTLFIIVLIIAVLQGLWKGFLINIPFMGCLNKIAGIIFYIVFYTLIFSVMIYFAEKVELLSEDTITTSRVYPVLQPIIIRLKQLL